jgi:hypothetical protein
MEESRLADISSMEKIIVGVSTASEKLAVMVILWTFDLS